MQIMLKQEKKFEVSMKGWVYPKKLEILKKVSYIKKYWINKKIENI